MDKWNGWYANLNENSQPFHYGNTITYEKAADFLYDCAEVEDWGCGGGYFKNFCKTKYIGVDGSNTPFASVKAELETYKSNVDGIMLRHVLEHNYQWKQILENAISSFNKKCCLILFTPLTTVTKEIAHNRHVGVDVPDISFSFKAIDDIIRENPTLTYTFETLNTATQYRVETIFYIEKTHTGN